MSPLLPSAESLFADDREVTQVQADKLVRSLPARLSDCTEGEYFKIGLIQGKWLDDYNNAERGGFNFSDTDEKPDMLNRLSKEQLYQVVAERVRIFRNEPIQEHTSDVKRRAESLIRNQMPECRTLISKLGEHVVELASARGERQIKGDAAKRIGLVVAEATAKEGRFASAPGEKINELYYRAQILVQEEASTSVVGGLFTLLARPFPWVV